MWDDHNAGKETSLNPLGMVEALIGAMQHAGNLEGGRDDITDFTNEMRAIMHRAMANGQGTRDLAGAAGLTTEQFVDHVAEHLNAYVAAK